jgi:hypothetical protein
MAELRKPGTADSIYKRGQAVRFSSKAPARWSRAARGRNGTFFPATDKCIVTRFPRNNPTYIYVTQEGRKSPICIHIDLITPETQSATTALVSLDSTTAKTQPRQTSTTPRRGRPKGIIDHQEVERYLALGFNMEKVVNLIQTTRATIYRQSQTDPALKAAIINGRKKGGTYTARGGRRIPRR